MIEHPLIFTQHTDRAIISKDYDQFFDNILVTSTFFTIQGEGPLGGHPAVFIRTADCKFGDKVHPSCNFCDTSFEFDKGTPYSPEELLAKVRSISPNFPVALVITGGEPTLQHNLVEFMRQL